MSPMGLAAETMPVARLRSRVALVRATRTLFFLNGLFSGALI
jgi:hypothetical protein